jgi:hypothetical protein
VPRVNIIRQTIYDENLDSTLLDYLNYMLYQASTMSTAYDIAQAPPFLFAEMVILFYRLTPFIQDNAVPAQAWDYLYEEYRMIFGDAGKFTDEHTWKGLSACVIALEYTIAEKGYIVSHERVQPWTSLEDFNDAIDTVNRLVYPGVDWYPDAVSPEFNGLLNLFKYRMDDLENAEDGREDVPVVTPPADGSHFVDFSLDPDLVMEDLNEIIDEWYTADEDQLAEIGKYLRTPINDPNHIFMLTEGGFVSLLQESVFKIPDFPSEVVVIQHIYAVEMFSVGPNHGDQITYILQDKDNFLADWQEGLPTAWYRYDENDTKTLSDLFVPQIAAMCLWDSIQRLTTQEQRDYTMYVSQKHEDEDGI